VSFFFRLNFFQFYNSTIGLLRIELHNMFWFAYLGLLWSHNSGHGFERLAHVNPGRSNMLLSQYLLKKYVILSFFESKYIFTSLSGCLWTHRVDRVISVHLPFFYLCLKFELHNFKLVYLWIWISIEIMFVELIFWNIYIVQPRNDTSKRSETETYYSNWKNRTPSGTELTILVACN
jgi:hypothetical protein